MADRAHVPVERPAEPVAYPGPLKRTSWGAIFAGMFVALAIEAILLVLGIAVGLSMLNPARGEGSPAAATTGVAIWWIVSTIIALFIGGWVAARLAGVPNRGDGTLHGFVTWGFTTVVALVFFGATLSAVGGAALGSRAGQEKLASLAPEVSQTTHQEAAVQKVRGRIEDEAKKLVQQGGKVKGNDLQDAQDKVADAIGRALDDPSPENRQAAAKALTDRTKLDTQQAKSHVDNWVRTFQQAKPEYREAGTPQAHKAQKGAAIAASTAWAMFLMLILGLVAAIIGGAVGSPSDYQAVDRTGREPQPR